MQAPLPSPWRAWFDGSAMPNPGRCTIGGLLLGPDGQRVEISRSAGEGDSSVAEYRALIAVLEAGLDAGVRQLQVEGDSKVVIDDVNGSAANAARVLHAFRVQARGLMAQFESLQVRWVPRHRNAEADALSHRAQRPETAWDARCFALAKSHAAHDDGAHDLNHLKRVWRTASELLRHHPEADRLVVMAACYLHDLVNLPKDHPERHLASRRSAELAAHELTALNFPPEKIAGVAHAIACHSFSAGLTPETIEARIVQDADRLDALGAVGLARMWYVSGRLGRPLAHPDDPLATSRTLDDQAWSLDHIGVKLEKLPDSMQTAAGRELGRRRLQTLLSFRQAFADEWLGA